MKWVASGGQIVSGAPVVQRLEPRRLMSGGLPRPDRIVIVIEENHDYADILGPDAGSDAPYLRSLARHGASFPRSHAVASGSLPNYLALFSGSTQGVGPNDSAEQSFSARSLGGQLIGNGMTFAGFSEDLPRAGFTGDSSGNYVRRHNPWVDFTDVPSWANQPFSNFPRTFKHLPTVSFVIPNLQHDMHDGTIRAADDWVRNNLSSYVAWAPKHNSLLIVDWDEGRTGDHIPTIFYGANVRRGNDYEHLNDYKVLRTIETTYGLAPLGEAANNGPASGAFVPLPAAAAILAVSRIETDFFSQTPVRDLIQPPPADFLA